MNRSDTDSHLADGAHRRGHGSQRRRSAFTLIELLVVISIIALLIAILLPSLKTARAQARAVVCATILKQHGTANHMYANEADDVFVPVLISTGPGYWDRKEWIENEAYRQKLGIGSKLSDYERSFPNGLICPDFPETVTDWRLYGMNWYGITFDWPNGSLQATRSLVLNPSQTIQLAEAGDWHIPNASYADAASHWDIKGEGDCCGYVAYRHHTGTGIEGMNALHFDAHVSYYTRDEAYPLTTEEQNRIWLMYDD